MTGLYGLSTLQRLALPLGMSARATRGEHGTSREDPRCNARRAKAEYAECHWQLYEYYMLAARLYMTSTCEFVLSRFFGSLLI